MITERNQIGFDGGVRLSSLVEFIDGSILKVEPNVGPMSTTAMSKAPQTVAPDAKLVIQCSDGKVYALPLYEE